MYQMTLFIKKVIYTKMIIINTHQKILNCNVFIKFSWVSMPPCGYVQRISLTHVNLHIRKIILTPYQIL